MGTYQNIELGAGKSGFGRRFYPECIESDSDLSLLNCTSIDVITNAHQVGVHDDLFDSVILCNPYRYGFIREEGITLLREIIRILKNEGQVILVASSRNPFCQPDRIESIVRDFCSGVETDIEMQVESIEPHEKYPDQKFYRVDGSETEPDTEIILKVQKK